MLKQFLKMLLLLVCASAPCNIHAKVLTPEEAAKIATDFPEEDKSDIEL